MFFQGLAETVFGHYGAACVLLTDSRDPLRQSAEILEVPFLAVQVAGQK